MKSYQADGLFSRKRLSHIKQKLDREIHLINNHTINKHNLSLIYQSIIYLPNSSLQKSVHKTKTIQKLVETSKNKQSSQNKKKEESENALHIKKDRKFKIFKTKLLERVDSIQNIDDERYRKLGLLGEGGSSYVYLTLDMVNKKKIVIKEYKKNSRKALKEYLIGKTLDHPNLPKYYFHQNNQIFMEYIQSEKPTVSSLFLIYQLALAINYLHQNGICHTDIKPKNIIITHQNLLKLIDFGNSLKDQIWKKGRSGTFGFMAPEMFQDHQWNGREVDIWSFGMVCKQWRIHTLAQYCLVERRLRPTISQVLSHPIFSQYLSK